MLNSLPNDFKFYPYDSVIVIFLQIFFSNSSFASDCIPIQSKIKELFIFHDVYKGISYSLILIYLS